MNPAGKERSLPVMPLFIGLNVESMQMTLSLGLNVLMVWNLEHGVGHMVGEGVN